MYHQYTTLMSPNLHAFTALQHCTQALPVNTLSCTALTRTVCTGSIPLLVRFNISWLDWSWASVCKAKSLRQIANCEILLQNKKIGLRVLYASLFAVHSQLCITPPFSPSFHHTQTLTAVSWYLSRSSLSSSQWTLASANSFWESALPSWTWSDRDRTCASKDATVCEQAREYSQDSIADTTDYCQRLLVSNNTHALIQDMYIIAPMQLHMWHLQDWPPLRYDCFHVDSGSVTGAMSYQGLTNVRDCNSMLILHAQ